jgi:hypothetical protein
VSPPTCWAIAEEHGFRQKLLDVPGTTMDGESEENLNLNSPHSSERREVPSNKVAVEPH